MRSDFILYLLLPVVLGLVACEPSDPNLPDDIQAPGLNIAAFEENLRAAFDGRVIGYGWAAYQQGVLVSSGGGGFARTVADGDPVPFDGQTYATLFSTTKTMTAALALRLLEQQGISPDQPFAPFLPATWDIHEDHLTTSFVDLMGHRSGMAGTFDTYTSMRNRLAQGADHPKSSRVYANINFTLFRVLIPGLLNLEGLNAAADAGDATARDYCAERYEGYVKGPLYDAGVPYHHLADTYYRPEFERTLYYSWWANQQDETIGDPRGLEMFDCHDISGGGGWFMTAEQFAAIIDGMYRFKVVDEATIERMQDDRLGINSTTGTHGTYYTHNGGDEWDSDPTGRGGQCVWMYFPPANLSVYLTLNSLDNDLQADRSVLLRNAFDEAANF
jgi:CubicO group peptidase (beta-lactamase class C family)